MAKKNFTVSEDTEVILNGNKYLLEAGDKIVINEDEGGWPEDVEEGGLRQAMGLDPNKPLEDQASASQVAGYFNDAGEKGRGMVMYAVNSNKDNKFWKKVGDMISDEED